MCIDSCVRFTGPFAELEHCPDCGASHYDQDELDKSNGENKVA